MPNLIVTGGTATSAGHGKYISRSKTEEKYRDDKILFNNDESNLSEDQSERYISNKGKKDGKYIRLVFSPDKGVFTKLGETRQERLLKMEKVVRESLKNLWEKLGVKDVKWIAGTHLNTAHPHTHIFFNVLAADAITGEPKEVPKIPRNWFWRENNDNSVIAKLFEAPVAASSIATPPDFYRTKRPLTELFLPARETEKARIEKTLIRLSEVGNISPHWVEHLIDNQSLYVNRQGALTFVRRNVEGYATGYVYENGYQPEDEKGFFYVGNPKTAKHFIVAETPKEVLAILELTGHRNLSEVCIVASDKKNVPLALTNHLKEISQQKPVRVVWALGLNRDDVQEEGNFEDFRIDLIESRTEKSPTLEFFSWEPKPGFGRTWNSQIQSRNLPGELNGITRKILIVDEQIADLVDENATRDYYQQVADAFRDVEIVNKENEFIVYAKTADGIGTEMGRYFLLSSLQANDSSIAYAIRSVGGASIDLENNSFTDEIEAIQTIKYLFEEKINAEFLEAADRIDQTQFLTEATALDESIIENAGDVIDARPPVKLSAKEITERVKEIPLEDVMPYLGLSLAYDRERREYVYRDNGSMNKIRVKGDLFCDRYNDNRGGRNAINLVMQVRGDNFADARAFLIDNLGTNFVPQETREKAIVRAEEKRAKVPFVMPERNDDKLPVVVDYLTVERGLNEEIVRRQIEEGNIFANSFGSNTFVYRNEDGSIKGAAWRAVKGTKRGDYAGTDKTDAWFYLGDIKRAANFIIVEAPIEAMSYYQLHPEVDLSTTAIVSTSMASVPASLINLLEKNAGENATIVIAYNNDKGGQRGAEFLLEKTGRFVLLDHKDHHLNDLIETTPFSGRILRDVPRLEDWNEDVKALRETEYYGNDAEDAGDEMDSIARPDILPQVENVQLDTLQIISMESSHTAANGAPRVFPVRFDTIHEFDAYIQNEKPENIDYKTDVKLTFNDGAALEQTFLVGTDLPDTLSGLLQRQIDLNGELKQLPAFSDRREELDSETNRYKFVKNAARNIQAEELKAFAIEENPASMPGEKTALNAYAPEMIRALKISAPLHFQGFGRAEVLLARENDKEPFFNIGYRIQIGEDVIERIPQTGEEKFAQGKQSLSNAYDEARRAVFSYWKDRGEPRFTLTETESEPDAQKYLAYLLNKTESLARDFSVRSFEKSFAIIPQFSDGELNTLRQWKDRTTGDEFFKVEDVFYREIPNAMPYQNLMHKLINAGLVEVRQEGINTLVKGGNPLTAAAMSYLPKNAVDALKLTAREARVIELEMHRNECAVAAAIARSGTDREYYYRQIEIIVEELNSLKEQNEKKHIAEPADTTIPEAMGAREINLGEDQAVDYQLLVDNPLKGIYDRATHKINVAFTEAYKRDAEFTNGFEFNYRDRIVTVLDVEENGMLLNFRINDGKSQGKNQNYTLGNLIHEGILSKESFEVMIRVSRTRQEILSELRESNMNLDYKATFAPDVTYLPNTAAYRINSKFSDGDYVLFRNNTDKTTTAFKQNVETINEQKVFSFGEPELVGVKSIAEVINHVKTREEFFRNQETENAARKFESENKAVADFLTERLGKTFIAAAEANKNFLNPLVLPKEAALIGYTDEHEISVYRRINHPRGLVVIASQENPEATDYVTSSNVDYDNLERIGEVFARKLEILHPTEIVDPIEEIEEVEVSDESITATAPEIKPEVVGAFKPLSGSSPTAEIEKTLTALFNARFAKDNYDFTVAVAAAKDEKGAFDLTFNSAASHNYAQYRIYPPSPEFDEWSSLKNNYNPIKSTKVLNFELTDKSFKNENAMVEFTAKRIIKNEGLIFKAPMLVPTVLASPQQEGRIEKRIAKLINAHGLGEQVANSEEFYVVLKNEPYMDLHITKDYGTNLIRLTHWYIQNGDMMHDGEMNFRLKEGKLSLNQVGVALYGTPRYSYDRTFANMFSNNLIQQGFEKATLVQMKDEISQFTTAEAVENEAAVLGTGEAIGTSLKDAETAAEAATTEITLEAPPLEDAEQMSGRIAGRENHLVSKLIPSAAENRVELTEAVSMINTKVWLPSEIVAAHLAEGVYTFNDTLSNTGRTATIYTERNANDFKAIHGEALSQLGLEGEFSDSQIESQRENAELYADAINLQNKLDESFAAKGLWNPFFAVAEIGSNVLEIHGRTLSGKPDGMPLYSFYETELPRSYQIGVGNTYPASQYQPEDFFFRETDDYIFEYEDAIAKLTGLLSEETNISQNRIETENRVKLGSQTEPAGVKKGTISLAEEVREILHSGASIGNNIAFNKIAERNFGGTRARGDFDARDAYDALELGVNLYLLDRAKTHDFFARPEETLRELRDLLRRLPIQSDRTDEQNLFQQFSTPPTEAFSAYVALGAKKGDLMVEPSAGNAGLAIWARMQGVDVHVNEISDRRAGILKILGFGDVTRKDAQFLNDTLDPAIKPNLILMNPPFSATGGRTKTNRTKYGAEHITDALSRLAPGGRLVAIVGEGMSFGKQGFTEWWSDVLAKYTVRANIGVPGEEYGKYGTTFGNQILVIDKTGATGGKSVQEQMESIAYGDMPDLEAVLAKMTVIAATRPDGALLDSDRKEEILRLLEKGNTDAIAEIIKSGVFAGESNERINEFVVLSAMLPKYEDFAEYVKVWQKSQFKREIWQKEIAGAGETTESLWQKGQSWKQELKAFESEGRFDRNKIQTAEIPKAQSFAETLYKPEEIEALRSMGYQFAEGRPSNDTFAVLRKISNHGNALKMLDNNVTIVPTRETYEQARFEATGAITGRVDRLEARGYRIIFGEPDKELKSELIGILSGQYADRFIEKGLSIEKIAFNRIERQDFISRADLKANPDKIYLFGDNLRQSGFGGQAKEMRGEPNAVGIPTKINPNNNPDSFFNDKDLLDNKIAINEAFAKLARFSPDTVIVIPTAGLGTGLAALEENAPNTFDFLQEKLISLDAEARFTDSQTQIETEAAEAAETTYDLEEDIDYGGYVQNDEDKAQSLFQLNEKELAAFALHAQPIIDSTNGQFGYLSDAQTPETENQQAKQQTQEIKVSGENLYGQHTTGNGLGNHSTVHSGTRRGQPNLFEQADSVNESNAGYECGNADVSVNERQSANGNGKVEGNQPAAAVPLAQPAAIRNGNAATEGIISGSNQGESGTGVKVHEEIAAQDVPENITTAALGIGRNTEKRERIDNLGVVEYKPAKLQGGIAHPGDIVESASMAAVVTPDITYTPKLDKKIIEEGLLSSLQLETVIYAGQRHEMRLGDGSRAGFFIGDGTGVGKGRELAGIALDNWNQDRKRILWLSINYDLVPSTERDMKGLGATDVPFHALNKHSVHADLENSVGDGLLFASYATLTGKGKDGSTRFDQIVKWLGEDGVIMFDEGHLAKNAVSFGQAEASQRGEAVVDLQVGEKSDPNWRIVYSSATGATELRNMAYMQRLGLWGEGSGFPGGFIEFHNTIDRGGVGSMEMVARDMKAAGMYCSRSLSMRGVDYRSVHHELTPEQRDIYNMAAKAWSDVARGFDDALQHTNANGKAKGMAYARLYSGQQMFFRQLMTAMKVPALIAETERVQREGSNYVDPKTGETRQVPAQVVIGVIGTGEARTKDQVSRAMQFGLDLDTLDFSPKQILLNVVESAFPTKRFTEETDPLSGKTIKVPVVDEDGRQVESQEALRMRDELLGELEERVTLPDNPLDQIVNYFGENAVAEITGRNKRIIIDPENGTRQYVKRAREGVAMDKASQDEMLAFQAGRKSVSIISQSASTGISLHAELKPILADYVSGRKLTAARAAEIQTEWDKNADVETVREMLAAHDLDVYRRVHITLETAWSADTQMQTFGRTHRSNEMLPPEYVLMSTDLGGEKRFLATIAKRLGSLGALTKGDREQAGGGNLLEYDFENKYGTEAAKKIVKMMRDGKPGFMTLLPPDPLTREERGGMEILYTMGIARREGNLYAVPEKTLEDLEVSRFLNRVLMLDVDTQNAVFDGFVQEMEAVIAHDKELGLFDEGVKDIEGTNIRLSEEPKVVSTDKTSGAETLYYKVNADTPTLPVTLEHIEDLNKVVRIAGMESIAPVNKGVFYQQRNSKNIIYTSYASTRAEATTGAMVRHYKFARPAGWQSILLTEKDLLDKYVPVQLEERREFADEKVMSVKDWWNKEVAETPKSRVQDYHLIAGAVLPVWQRLASTNERGDQMSLKTVRIETDDGTRIVGVEIPARQINRVLRDLGVQQSFKTPGEIFDAVLETKETVDLVGGIRLRPTFLKKQPAIEVVNLSIFQKTEFQNFGAQKEIISFSDKYFVPTDRAKGVEVLEKVLERYPAVDKTQDDARSHKEQGEEKKSTSFGEKLNEMVNNLSGNNLSGGGAVLAKVLENQNSFSKQADAIRGKQLSDYWMMIKAESNEKGQVTISAGAYEFLRVAYKQTFREDVKKFEGLFNDPDTADRFMQTLDYMEENCGIYCDTISSLTKTLAEARNLREDKAIILLTNEKAAMHEEAHASSHIARLGQDLVDGHARFDELVNSESYAISKPILAAKYGTENDGLLIEETFAYVASGDGKEIGLNKEQSGDFAELWFTSVAEKNPEYVEWILSNFKEICDESKQARDNAYESIAQDKADRFFANYRAERDEQIGGESGGIGESGQVGQYARGDNESLQQEESNRVRISLVDEYQFRAKANRSILEQAFAKGERVSGGMLYKLDEEETSNEIGEILEEYGIATPEGNNVGTLAGFVEKYPTAAEDLISFAADRDLIRDERFDEMDGDQAQDSLEARFEMYAREVSRLTDNRPIEQSGAILYKTFDSEAAGEVKGDEIFTEFQSILKEAGLEKLLESKNGKAEFETAGKYPSRYELEIAEDEIIFLEKDEFAGNIYLESDPMRGISFGKNTAGKFQYTGSFEFDAQSGERAMDFDKAAGAVDVQRWQSLGSRLVATRVSAEADVEDEIETANKQNLEKYASRQLGHELLAEIAHRVVSKEAVDFQNNLDNEQLKVNAVSSDGKEETREISRADLRRECQAIACADVENARTSGVLQMIADDDAIPLEKVEKRQYARATVKAEAMLKPWIEGWQTAAAKETNRLEEKTLAARTRWQEEKSETASILKQGGIENAAGIKPTLPPENVWVEQIKAVKRGDAEIFARLEEIHKATGLPRPNDVLARLRGMETVAALAEREEHNDLLKWIGQEKPSREKVVVNVRAEKGELKVENWRVREVRERHDQILTQAEENLENAARERKTANQMAMQPLINKINPFSPIRGTASWMTQPKETLKAHLNPVQIVRNDPAVQIIRAVSGYVEHKQKSKQLKEMANAAVEEAGLLREKLAPGAANNASRLSDAVKSAIEAEEALRTGLRESPAVNADLLETPERGLTDAEMKSIGRAAIETGDTEETREYYDLVKSDTEFATVVGESEETLSVKSLLAEARAVWQAREAIESVKPLADGSIDVELNPAQLTDAVERLNTADVFGEVQTASSGKSLIQRLSLEEVARVEELLAENNPLTESLNNRVTNIGNDLITSLQPPLNQSEKQVMKELTLTQETQLRFAEIRNQGIISDILTEQAETATRNKIPFQQTAQNFMVENPNSSVEAKEMKFWQEDRTQREAQIMAEKAHQLSTMTEAEKAERAAVQAAESAPDLETEMVDSEEITEGAGISM